MEVDVPRSQLLSLSMSPMEPILSSAPKYQRLMSIKDLNSFGPTYTIELEDEGTHLYSTWSPVFDETILAVTSKEKAVFYSIHLKPDNVELDENRVIGDNEKEKTWDKVFNFSVIKTVQLQEFKLEAFAFSSVCSTALPPRRLAYAISVSKDTDNRVYLCDFQASSVLPNSFTISPKLEVGLYEGVIEFVSRVCRMAIQTDQYLAVALENRTLIVYNIQNCHRQFSITLPSKCVHLSWHPSEPYKLLTVEANGYVKFFNVHREMCFMSFFLSASPVFTANWAFSGTNLITVGFSGGFTILNTSQLTSTLFEKFDYTQKDVHITMFNPQDDKSVFTYSRFPGELRLWRRGVTTHVWMHGKNNIFDAVWMKGKPFIIALGFRSLYFYDGSNVY